jgi:hypothetical protein
MANRIYKNQTHEQRQPTKETLYKSPFIIYIIRRILFRR